MPPAERDSQLRLARVYLAQARATPHRSFAFTLIEWAGNARRRAFFVEQPNAGQLELSL